MATGDVLRCEFQFNVARQPCAFTLHYQVDNSGTTNMDDSCFALGQLMQSTEMADFHFNLAGNVTYEGWETRFLRGTDAFGPYRTQILNSTGSRSGHAISQVSSCVVRLQQDTRDSKFNGRIYVPGISEQDTTMSSISAQVVLDGIRDDLLDVLVVSGNVGGVDWAFQQIINGGSKQTGFTETPVTTLQVNSLLGSSRRRLTREFGTIP